MFLLFLFIFYFFSTLSKEPWKIAVETVEKHEVIRGICRLIDYAVLFWVLGDSSLYSFSPVVVLVQFSSVYLPMSCSDLEGAVEVFH